MAPISYTPPMPKPKPRRSLRTAHLGLHPRNRHPGRYDFDRLIQTCPELKPYVAKNKYGDLSIEFSDPKAVRMLNRALLQNFYPIQFWDFPADYLCPPIPGRSDYLHYAADLLAADHADQLQQGPHIRVLDLGVGASCVYPIVGHFEYGWSWVGSEIDAAALASAQKIIDAHPQLKAQIELRKQSDPKKMLEGVAKPGERFHLVICNPPFHRSAEEAAEGSTRKWHNLGRHQQIKNPGIDAKPVLNFGGKNTELWCEGGEALFIERFIHESTRFSKSVVWFTTLVSKSESLPNIEAQLDRAKVGEKILIEMSQGQKISRIVAWTYLTAEERAAF